MLYKINPHAATLQLQPLEFRDLASFGKLEKDLENLVASSLLETLFEDSSLMPIFQERPYQAEADIYALNAKGDVIIFELKRSDAGQDAVHQALRYAQVAGQWTYAELEKKYQSYSGSSRSLSADHKASFRLEHEVEPRAMNSRQHMLVIGSASDEELRGAVDYWKSRGLSIDFLPYRLYEISGDIYFEFFAPPYDNHQNPGLAKGVLFDTNATYDEESIWDMMKSSTIAAYGDAIRFIDYVNPGDIVFYSHKGVGIVAAARVKRGEIKTDGPSVRFRDVQMLTAAPSREAPLMGIPFARVSEVTGKSFYWARTVKVPYLNRKEADQLLAELIAVLGAAEPS
jgi:hypothetical protein